MCTIRGVWQCQAYCAHLRQTETDRPFGGLSCGVTNSWRQCQGWRGPRPCQGNRRCLPPLKAAFVVASLSSHNIRFYQTHAGNILLKKRETWNALSAAMCVMSSFTCGSVYLYLLEERGLFLSDMCGSYCNVLIRWEREMGWKGKGCFSADLTWRGGAPQFKALSLTIEKKTLNRSATVWRKEYIYIYIYIYI